VLRRSKTIVFKDDLDSDEGSSSETELASPRGARREFDLRGGASRPSPRLAAREVEPDDSPEPTTNPVHERMDFLRSELEDAPISKGSQESLAALRAEFRRKHVEGAEDAAQQSLPRFSFGGLKPSRILLVLVALVAGGVAAYLAVGRNVPAVEPVAPVAAPVVVAAPTAQVLVAKTAIGIGQRLSAETVEWQSWPETALRPDFITDAKTPEAITEMDGAMARFEFFPGEPIRKVKLAEKGAGFLSAVLSSGMRGVSVSISASSASGGFVVPNDRVDVVLTQRSDSGNTVSKTILNNVRVLAIDSRLGDTGGSGGDAEKAPDEVFSGGAIATLELDPTQAEVIINAATLGELSLMLRPLLDFAEAGKPEQRPTNQAIRISSPFWTK
jgi:pilus assembly protein CpaB